MQMSRSLLFVATYVTFQSSRSGEELMKGAADSKVTRSALKTVTTTVRMSLISLAGRSFQQPSQVSSAKRIGFNCLLPISGTTIVDNGCI